jgi:hypothetical protein
MAREKDSGTVKAVVLVDRYSHHNDFGDPASGVTSYPDQATDGSAKGTEIEVSAEEFERGASMTPPALAKAGSKEAKRFLGTESLPDRNFAELSDSDLAAVVAARGGNPDDMNRDQLLGFVTGTPDNPSSNPAKS